MSRRPAIERATIERPAFAALVLGLLLPLCLAACAGGSAGESGEGSPGEPSAASTGAPAGRDDPYAKLSLQDPQGRTIRLGDFKGQVRLIDVWAT
jgi:cytochrome oxidase Cu insertion factor (SCO1/SenC/PrrC family)